MRQDGHEFSINLKQLRPYYDTLGDGKVQLSFTLPMPAGPAADRAAEETLRRMNLTDVALVERRSIAPRFTFFVAYARTTFSVDAESVGGPVPAGEVLSEAELDALVRSRVGRRLVVVGATLESDAHTVGLDAILNMKGVAGHPGLEHYPCFRTLNLGAQVPFQTLLEVIRREGADILLLSQTVTQKDLHFKNLTRLADLLEAEGLRPHLITVVGGPNITPELARELGYDAGFGRGAVPGQVAEFIVREFLRRRQ